MQAAYNKFRDASAVLDATTEQPQGTISYPDGSPRIGTATSEQRAAFENYIEARMQFVEFQCDRQNAATRDFAGPNTVESSRGPSQVIPVRGAWPVSKISRLALPAAVVALLCTTALTLAYAVHERRQVRDSDAARDQISAMLSQTRDDIQAVVRKLDAVNVTQRFVVRESDGAIAKPVSPPRAHVTQAAARKPVVQVWRRIPTPLSAPNKPSNVDTTHEKLIHKVQNLGGSTSWAFTLPVSKRFQSVGPLRLSLRLVNLKYRYLDLCIMADDFKLKHVNLHEPVRIILRDPSRRLELVVTRIDKNHVHGHLNELKYRKSELTASHVRRKTSGGTKELGSSSPLNVSILKKLRCRRLRASETVAG
jgi:hypothetical protein